jgi:2'-5' RNA ligase
VTYRPKLFAGLELDERTRAWSAAIAARLQACAFPGRFEAPEKFHITLAFLGWVVPEHVEAIREVVREAASRAKPFTLTLDKIGAFPHERKPRIVWLGAHRQGEEFRRLSRDVQTAYERLGFTFAQEAVAHVTIARVKGGLAHLPVIEVEPIALPVTHLTLFESLPAQDSTRYEVRERAPLNAHA